MADAFSELERKLYYELYVIRTMIYEIQHPQPINHQNAFMYQQYQQPAYNPQYNTPVNPYHLQQQKQPVNTNYYAHIQPESTQQNQQIPASNTINVIPTTTESTKQIFLDNNPTKEPQTISTNIYTSPTTTKVITSTATTTTTEKSFEFKPIFKQKIITKMISTTERIPTTTARRPEVIQPQLKTLEPKPTDTKQARYKTLK